MKYNLLQDLLRFKPIYCDVYLIYYFTVYSSYQLIYFEYHTSAFITIYYGFIYYYLLRTSSMVLNGYLLVLPFITGGNL